MFSSLADVKSKQGSRFRSSLRTRLLLLVIGVVSAVVLSISTYFIRQHQADLRAAKEERTALMKEELKRRGLAVARNVALSSERAIAVLDFLFLAEVLNTTKSNDSEVLYGIIMNNERSALVHTDNARAGTTLDDPDDLRAAAISQPDAFERVVNGERVLEVDSPIEVGEKRWGTVRFGLSLKRLDSEIAQAEKVAAQQITDRVVAIIVGSLLLLLVASMGGALLASKIVGPLGDLMAGVNRIREGSLDQQVKVVGDTIEFEALATAFNDMTVAIKQRDVTLRQHLQDLEVALTRAEEANRLKGEFLANVSHELRTPLNAIINVPGTLLRDYSSHQLWVCGSCNAMFEDDPPPAGVTLRDDPCPTCQARTLAYTEKVFMNGDANEHRHFLGRLKQQARHLYELVNDLLDFSKLEAKKMKLFPVDVELGRFFDEFSVTMSSLADEKGVRLVVDSAGAQAVKLRADPLKLTQILNNLVGNAIKFTHSGGQVSVTARNADAGQVRFEVTDTGIGIPRDKFGIIFESFRQVDGSDTRGHGGTGLGLAIVRQLVELHGGHIGVDSVMGQGSTFFFELPAIGPPATPDEETLPASARGVETSGAKRILVIDDSTMQLELIGMLLQRRGYVADLVSRPEDAVARATQNRPDLVILDMVMPELNGLAVLAQLKSNPATKQVPVIVASAYATHREAAEKLGGLWLPKPWEAAELMSLLSRCLATA